MAGTGAELATAYVTILPSTRGLGAALASQLQGPSAAAGKAAGKAAGSSMSSAFATAGSLIAAAGIGSMLKSSASAASDLSESINKVRVVFGSAADSVIGFGKDAATSMGMSNQTALEAAGTFGNLFVSMGLADSKSADMSTSIVTLAGDLASFNNADPTAVLEALRAGLVGETEPLRKFGINLNDATLQQKALSLGLTKDTKSVLPAAIKAQAAYALMFDQTATAQGDFARTSDGVANKQRIVNAQWKDAKAALGKALLPALSSVLDVASASIGVFSSLPQPLQNIAITVGAVGTSVAIALPWLSRLKEAYLLVKAAALGTAAAEDAAAASAVTGSGATGVAGVGAGAAKAAGVSGAGNIAIGGLAAKWAGFAAVLGKALPVVGMATAANESLDGMNARAARHLGGFTDAAKASSAAVAGTASSSSDAAGAQDGLASSISDATTAWSAQTLAMSPERSSMESFLGQLADVKAKEDALTSTLKTNGKGSAEAQLAAMQLKDAQDLAAQSAGTLTGAQGETAASAVLAAVKSHTLTKEQGNLMLQAAGAKVKIDGVGKSLKLLPAKTQVKIMTSVTMGGVDNLISKLRTINALNQFNAGRTTSGVQGGGGVGHAAGGYFTTPHIALVAEQPEYIINPLRSNARELVAAAARDVGMLASGTTQAVVSITNYVTAQVSNDYDVERLADKLARAQSSRARSLGMAGA